jgi:hypothetical protein
MNPTQWAAAGAIGLFFAMLACLEAGFRVGQRSSVAFPEQGHEGISDIGAAVFALLGLLLAFSFAGGISRLDARRQMIVQEANAISAAYSRLDLLPTDDQPEMRRLFRKYLDSRLHAYEEAEEESTTVMQVAQLQQEIWSHAVAATRADPSLKLLLLPAINQMTDLTTMRTIAGRTHLPGLILALMTVVALLSALVAGYTMSKRNRRSWFHALIYAGVIAITFYVVLDLEYPRAGGFIGLETADQALRELRGSMH